MKDEPVPGSEPPPWQVLGSRLLLDHVFHRVVADRVRLPSGEETEWLQFADERDFVIAICLDERGRVLVARQYCHAPGRVVHEFPGGFIDPGASAADAARREVREETGFEATVIEHVGTFLPHRRRSAVRGHVHLATGLRPGKPEPEAQEIIALEWIPVETIEGMIAAGRIEDAHLLAAWAIFRARRPALFGA